RFPIVPRHVWEGIAQPLDVTDPELLVGSGPYRLTAFDPKRSGYEFEANDDYFLGRPFVKQVGFHQVNDELIALRAGDIDSAETPVGRPTRQALSAFGDTDTYGILAGKPDFFAALSWNLSLPGPTSDVRFRRACAMALDRSEMVARLLGDGEPGNPGVLPPDHAFHADVEQYAFDVAGANALLDEAGYPRKKGSEGVRVGPGGEDLRLTLLTFPEGAATAEILKQSLAAIGVELEFQPSDFFTAIAGGLMTRYEMALLFFGGVRRDPDSLRTMLASSTAGTGIFHALGWANAEFDTLADQQLVNLDDASRKTQVARMQELVAEDLPFLVLYYSVPYYVYRRQVFDQWSAEGEAKFSLVTGRAGGGLAIRPIAG
ncbi:MAG: ABC transporter substrate-binding protein, partial [Actinomycetota bacterium]